MCCLLLPLFLTPALLHAQATAILRGRVLDPSGAVIPNASVTAAGPGQAAHAAETDSDGSFRFASLNPGRYTVRVSAPGFNPAQEAAELAEGRILTLDFKLSVALERQEVNVEDHAQVSAEAGANASATVVSGTQLDMLSDNPDDLQTDLMALAGPAVGPDGGQIYVDGFSNGQLPPKESIREIRVNSDPFSAQYDRVGYGRIEILTKPGTDTFRGSVGMVFADSALNARNPFAPNKPSTQMRQYQTELTGSINRKTSFNLEANHATQDSTALVNAVVLDSNFNPVPYVVNLPAPNYRTTVSPRVDYAISPNNTLQARYSVNHPTSENNNIGGIRLPSRATSAQQTQQNMLITDTAAIGSRWINDLRFQYRRSRTDQEGETYQNPGIQVLDAFAGGGAQFHINYYHSDNWEIQNYTSYSRGTHYVKFGIRIRNALENGYSSTQYNGLFVYNSIESYAVTAKGLAAHLSLDQIRAQGGGPAQYTVTGGNPLASVFQIDAAPFAQDDWRLRPNLTLSLGLRYEIQNNISDKRAWAPRLGIAWGLGKGTGRNQPKTVLRAGFGLFYDRFSEGSTLTARRANGIVQQNVVLAAPDFACVEDIPCSVPPISALLARGSPGAIRVLDRNLQAPQTIQSAFGVERQLPRNITLTLNFTDSRGVHQFRTRNINAPLPGTYESGNPVYPFGYGAGQMYLWESSGLFKQSQLSATANARVNARLIVFGNYTYGHFNSNTDGLGSFPMDQYNTSAEWGRANRDVRQQVNFGGSITTPLAIQFNPQITAATSTPFNIVTGSDANGDTLFLDRPAFATDMNRPSVVRTAFGAFDAKPMAGQTIVPKNYAPGFSSLFVNLRAGRTWNFGEARGSGGKGRYSINASVQARNLLNAVNPATPTGTLTSPLFGLATSLQGNQNANRRLELQLRFAF
jgi:hypothetical protein